MANPSEADLRTAIRDLVGEVDLNTTGVKKFTKLLQRKLGVGLQDRAAFIRETLTEIINEEDDDQEEEDDEEEEQEQEQNPRKRRAAKKPSKKGGSGGLTATKEISAELAEFLGKGRQMARTEIVKLLWEYIREHDLQNPDNKKEIFLDDRMKAVFGCDSFTMFTMNKYIGAHVHPYKPVDLTTSTPKKKRKGKSTKDGSAKRRKAGGGLQAPYQLSPELAMVVGRQILPRPQVTKKLWKYIRANDLQNPDDKREILCDSKLKRVMGGKSKVTMFSMNKFISDHLLEKLDKSYYVPSDEEQEQATGDDDSNDESAED